MFFCSSRVRISYKERKRKRVRRGRKMKTKENIVEKKESIVRSDLRVSVVHALEKEMATRSSVLAWRIPGMAEPGGLPFMGSHRVRHN